MSASEVGGDAEAALLTKGLAHKYGDFAALAPIDLRIGLGELVALVGPNGAGKTTLITMVAGLLEPSGGVAQIDGHRAGSLAARAAVSYIPDTPVLYDDLSLNEHLEYIARLHGVQDWAPRAQRLLRRLGLEAWGENLPSEFSRGMRQKAAIAIGLIRPFSLLLADEPFDGLDPASRDVLFELLDETRQSGSAVLVSTHRSEVVEIADRCVALSEGALAYDGRPDPRRLATILPDSG
jgi:ABC-type multidrug transport system ATPase subunit